MFKSPVPQSPQTNVPVLCSERHTMLEIRRPIPRIAVKANITFCRPSTLVLHIPLTAVPVPATKQGIDVNVKWGYFLGI